MEYILDDLNSLHRLRNERTLRNIIRKIKVTGKDVNRLSAFEKRLNKYYFACGCAEGQIAVWGTILAFSILWIIDRNAGVLVWWKLVPCLFASALLGKMVGLLMNHLRLQQMYSELESVLTTEGSKS